MDQHTSHGQRNIEVQQAVMSEDMGKINERVQETVEGVQSTVHRAVEGFKQMQTGARGRSPAARGRR